MAVWILVALWVGTSAVAMEPDTLAVLTEAVMDLEHQIEDAGCPLPPAQWPGDPALERRLARPYALYSHLPRPRSARMP